VSEYLHRLELALSWTASEHCRLLPGNTCKLMHGRTSCASTPTRGFDPQSISNTLHDGNPGFVNVHDLVLSFVFDLSVSVLCRCFGFSFAGLVRNKLYYIIAWCSHVVIN